MQILTVTQVNTYIKAVLDEIPPVQNAYIGGEISNYKHYYQSGHMYFTLKDEKSQLKCVMFSSDSYKLKFKPENGMKVICFGKIGVYERDGVYQLYCRDMQPQGVGSLQLAFEQLKGKLEEEGLFDEQYKKPIPKFPKRIGVATSNMGAAVEDIKNVISRRYPLCEIVIVPTVVQGDNAGPDIAKSIKFLDDLGDIDVIIVGRGGGSLEDLWAFNTEIVARAVFNCKTPIISAVGHETDYTICDFISDLRAPTPSAAAELAVPDIKSLIVDLNNLSISIEKAIDYKIEAESNRLNGLKNHPAICNRALLIENALKNISDYRNKLSSMISQKITSKQGELSSFASSLNALSPLNTIARGYSISMKNGNLIRSVQDVAQNDKITIKVKDGSFNAIVTNGE